MATDQFKKQQLLRRAAAKLLAQMPKDLLQTPEAEVLAAEAGEKVYNVIQLIYRSKNYEGTSKDYQFSRRMMEEHWTSGYNDAVRTLRHPEVLQRPNGRDGFFTIQHFDGFNAYLVQLDEVTTQDLREALVDGWLALAPAQAAEGFLGK